MQPTSREIRKYDRCGELIEAYFAPTIGEEEAYRQELKLRNTPVEVTSGEADFGSFPASVYEIGSIGHIKRFLRTVRSNKCPFKIDFYTSGVMLTFVDSDGLKHIILLLYDAYRVLNILQHSNLGSSLVEAGIVITCISGHYAGSSALIPVVASNNIPYHWYKNRNVNFLTALKDGKSVLTNFSEETRNTIIYNELLTAVDIVTGTDYYPVDYFDNEVAVNKEDLVKLILDFIILRTCNTQEELSSGRELQILECLRSLVNLDPELEFVKTAEFETFVKSAVDTHLTNLLEAAQALCTPELRAPQHSLILKDRTCFRFSGMSIPEIVNSVLGKSEYAVKLLTDSMLLNNKFAVILQSRTTKAMGISMPALIMLDELNLSHMFPPMCIKPVDPGEFKEIGVPSGVRSLDDFYKCITADNYRYSSIFNYVITCEDEEIERFVVWLNKLNEYAVPGVQNLSNHSVGSLMGMPGTMGISIVSITRYLGNIATINAVVKAINNNKKHLCSKKYLEKMVQELNSYFKSRGLKNV